MSILIQHLIFCFKRFGFFFVFLPWSRVSEFVNILITVAWLYTHNNHNSFCIQHLLKPYICFGLTSILCWKISLSSPASYLNVLCCLTSSHSQRVSVDANNVSSENAENGHHSVVCLSICQTEEKTEKAIFSRLLLLPFLSSTNCAWHLH